jgi:AraC-like DNA-binding protein
MSANTGASVATGAMSGAGAGAMVGGPWGAVAGGLIGGAGGLASGLAGDREAERRDKALKAWQKRSADIYGKMALDAWNQGTERQRATGTFLEGLPDAMGADPSAASDVASFLEAGPSGRGDAYDQVMAQAAQPRMAVDQANLNATQAGMDRDSLNRVLQALGYSSGIESAVNDPQHKRYQWQQEQDLEEARRRLEEVLGTTDNANNNLALLGNGIQTAGQLAMLYGSMSGGPASNVPGTSGAGASTYGGGATPGPAVGGGSRNVWSYTK